MTEAYHIPVMGAQAVAALNVRDGGIYVDGTFGAGGYTRQILEAADCQVIAFDRDPSAIKAGSALMAEFGSRLTLVERPFGEMGEALRQLDIEAIDGLVLDLGVSSMQIDQAERGFSFAKHGPLNMRMDKAEGMTAQRLVMEADERTLADIIHYYGEDRKARSIARAIVRAREKSVISSTDQLADIVLSVAGPLRPDRIHPATRTFQALRIYINDELGQLVKVLLAAEEALAPSGRLVVVTFHSLEDRIVKRFFILRSGLGAKPSRHLPVDGTRAQEVPVFELVSKKPLLADDEELTMNPRARSAKLRVAARRDGPVPPVPEDFVKQIGLPHFAAAQALSTPTHSTFVNQE